MPRKALGARLYLRRDGDKKVWIIRDRNRDFRTGCEERDKLAAMRALAEYKQDRPIPAKPIIGSGQIYFVTCLGSENYPIKIGWTSFTLASRIAQMQIGNPNLLQVVGALPGTQDDERVMHATFQHHHIRGEWFRRGDDLIDFIGEISGDDRVWGVDQFEADLMRPPINNRYPNASPANKTRD